MGSKFVSDSISSLVSQSNNFGSWEDYALVFISGGFMQGLNVKGPVKYFIDIALTPLATQTAKMNTRGTEFNLGKYVYDVTLRALTVKCTGLKHVGYLFNSKFEIAFSKSILRGFGGGLWKIF